MGNGFNFSGDNLLTNQQNEKKLNKIKLSVVRKEWNEHKKKWNDLNREKFKTKANEK